MKIKFSKLASQDLQSTKDYISQDKPNAALAIVKRVIEPSKILQHSQALVEQVAFLTLRNWW